MTLEKPFALIADVFGHSYVDFFVDAILFR